MVLDQEKIKEEILRPSKSQEIRAAVTQQDWIKFHSDTNLDVINTEPYRKFKDFVKSQLPADKFLSSINNLKFPLPTQIGRAHV